jgi:hypothetical protein
MKSVNATGLRGKSGGKPTMLFVQTLSCNSEVLKAAEIRRAFTSLYYRLAAVTEPANRVSRIFTS